MSVLKKITTALVYVLGSFPNYTQLTHSVPDSSFTNSTDSKVLGPASQNAVIHD